MTVHQTDAALEFLRVLAREFPTDPDALYVSIHAYSDLSTFLSQELARGAPSSYQARELLAESFETQGKWDDAEKEYRAILQQDPNLPGIHFRLGAHCFPIRTLAPRWRAMPNKSSNGSCRSIPKTLAPTTCWANWRARTSSGRTQ